MGNSKIEQIVEELNDYIDSCRPLPFSKTQIVVSKDDLQSFLDQLRMSTPEEIKRYQKIISNRDTIIKDAETKAGAIVKAAEERAAALVSENSIFQDACQKAQEMLSDATIRSQSLMAEANNESTRILFEANKDAEQIHSGAIGYANEILGDIESAISTAYESISTRSSMLVETIKANLDTIVSNRMELNGEAAPPQQLASVPADEMLRDADDADYSNVEDEIMDFDGETFLNDAEDVEE